MFVSHPHLYEPSRKAEHLFWLYLVGTHSVGRGGQFYVYHRPSAWSERRQHVGNNSRPRVRFLGPILFLSANDCQKFIY